MKRSEPDRQQLLFWMSLALIRHRWTSRKLRIYCDSSRKCASLPTVLLGTLPWSHCARPCWIRLVWLGDLSLRKSRRWPVFGALDAISTGCLIWASRPIRRRTGGYNRSDLRLGSEEQRIANRKTSARFRWVVMGEWSGIGLAAFATYHFGRGDLFPPAMSLVIALHFFPLAALFRLTIYRATASASSIICITALLLSSTLLGPDSRLVLTGVGFGAVMWATAAYCVVYSERLAAASQNEMPSI